MNLAHTFNRIAKADATYAGLLQKLADHERMEMDYIDRRFPDIRSGKTKKSTH